MAVAAHSVRVLPSSGFIIMEPGAWVERGWAGLGGTRAPLRTNRLKIEPNLRGFPAPARPAVGVGGAGGSKAVSLPRPVRLLAHSLNAC